MIATVVIVIVLVLIAFFALRSYRKKLDSGCCGASGERVKRNRVADRNRDHYPYQAVLTVDGMVCGNCAARIENTLNALDGVWAEADVAAKRVTVRMKQPVSEEILRSTVNAIGGYTVMAVQM